MFFDISDSEELDFSSEEARDPQFQEKLKCVLSLGGNALFEIAGWKVPEIYITEEERKGYYLFRNLWLMWDELRRTQKGMLDIQLLCGHTTSAHFRVLDVLTERIEWEHFELFDA